MERLDLSASPENPQIEAAIHLARYANILPFVKDKIVLDAACGEGYGAALLMMAGAKRVVGVDVSETAIEKARIAFSESGAEFLCADVSELESKYEANTFDIIVSIETIEHVPDDEAFLKTLLVLGKKSALFYLTCPNDHWYYPTDDQRNPYHLRKYSLEDFQKVSTRILGDHVQWGLGGPVFGFGTVNHLINEVNNQLHESWMRMEKSLPGFSVVNSELSPITDKNCSYFAGIWNLSSSAEWAVSAFPLSMDAYSKMYMSLISQHPADAQLAQLKVEIENHYRMAEDLNRDIEVLKQNNAALTETNESLDKLNQQLQSHKIELERESRNKGLLLSAAQAENEALRNNMYHIQAQLAAAASINSIVSHQHSQICALQSDVERMNTGYWRYVRLSQAIPAPMKKVAVKIVRFIKHNSKKEAW